MIAILGALLALTARAGTAAGDPAAGDLLAGDGGALLDAGAPLDDADGLALDDDLALDGLAHGDGLAYDALGGLEGLALDGLGALAIGDGEDRFEGIQQRLALDGLDGAAAASSKVLPLAVEAARRAHSAELATELDDELSDELARRRPWWWSQLDLTIAWRRTVASTATKGTTRASELWVLAAWSL